MDGTYRILLTASRNWDDVVTMVRKLEAAIQRGQATGRSVLVVHGDNGDGDKMAERYCRHRGVETERHPPDWSKGRAGGPIRNKKMVRLGADECVAFIKGGSPGATGCAGLAEGAGIPVRRYAPGDGTREDLTGGKPCRMRLARTGAATRR